MNAASREPDRERAADLRFFGLVTASASHQLNNVNSTIEQLAGLLEDHLRQVAGGGTPDPDRLRNLHERIVRQTRRATETIEQLNRFAHTADDPRTRCDVAELLAVLRGLAARPAERHRVELELAPADGPVEVTGDPFLILQTTFAHLQEMWETADAGATITLAAGTDDAGATIRLAAPAPEAPGPESDRASRPAELAERLGAAVGRDVVDGRRQVTIGIPAQPA